MDNTWDELEEEWSQPTGVATIVRMGPLSIKSRPRREAAIWCLCPWATILGEPLLFLQLDPKLFLVPAKLCCGCQKFDFQTTQSLQVVKFQIIQCRKIFLRICCTTKVQYRNCRKNFSRTPFYLHISESKSNIYCSIAVSVQATL